MIIHDEYQQNSVEWLQARTGVVTASELHNLVTPLWKIKVGDAVDSYLARKIAERWLQGPLLDTGSSLDMEFGKIRETEAIPWYEFRYDRKIRRVGFITSDDGRLGCSPDGLFEASGIEIKCPLAQTHVGYLMANEVPPKYLAQVHGSMFVTRFESWQFLSYREPFPPLLLTVHRDEKVQKVIEEATDLFLERFEASWTALCDLNGGPPAPRVQFVPSSPDKPRFTWEQQQEDVPS